jgi:hypothetical protein
VSFVILLGILSMIGSGTTAAKVAQVQSLREIPMGTDGKTHPIKKDRY